MSASPGCSAWDGHQVCRGFKGSSPPSAPICAVTPTPWPLERPSGLLPRTWAAGRRQDGQCLFRRWLGGGRLHQWATPLRSPVPWPAHSWGLPIGTLYFLQAPDLIWWAHGAPCHPDEVKPGTRLLLLGLSLPQFLGSPQEPCIWGGVSETAPFSPHGACIPAPSQIQIGV